MQNKKVKIEFHIHTRYSKDSILGKYILYIMCKIRKINCLAITDHNSISGALNFKNFFEKRNIKIIVGEEIFSKDGEIIGLFLSQRIAENLSAIETVSLIKKQNGIVYIPHPYDEKRKKTVIKKEALKAIIDKVDLIEIHNGRNIKEEYSNIQRSIAEKYKKVGIVGSDAHTFYEIGRNYCLINNLNKNTFIEEIKNATFQTKKCLKIAHYHTLIVRILKLILRGEFDELRRIISRRCQRKKQKTI